MGTFIVKVGTKETHRIDADHYYLADGFFHFTKIENNQGGTPNQVTVASIPAQQGITTVEAEGSVTRS